METDRKFVGDVRVEWLSEPAWKHRDMKLTAKFEYHEMGKVWVANVGDIVNGASIPPLLWSVMGSPFVGNYRRASVIHDVYCVRKTETWQNVHYVFYRAMLTDGTPDGKAYTMFLAVWKFGPRWADPSGRGGPVSQPPCMTQKDLDEIERLAEDLATKLDSEPSPETLVKLAEERIPSFRDTNASQQDS